MIKRQQTMFNGIEISEFTEDQYTLASTVKLYMT